MTLRVPTAANIFSAQQERALGDIEAELVENNYRAAHDDGQALVHVILIDTPETQSFPVAPERIYITQKMAALLRNDGELAGLLGHELGHILAHQNAIIVSQLFHEILGGNVVSGRKDVSGELTRMFSSIDRDTKLSRKAASIIDRQEGIHQIQADCVALYASAAAGSSPQGLCGTF